MNETRIRGSDLRKRSMSARMLTVLALSTAGCASPWPGTYEGNLTWAGSCSDGSSYPAGNNPTAYMLTQDGELLSWSLTCGAAAHAIEGGSTARVEQCFCPTVRTSTGSVDTTIMGGTLTLSGGSLVVNLMGTSVLSEGATHTCSITITGTLQRR